MPTSGFVESMPVFCNWSWGHPREMFLLVNGVMILRLLYDLLYIDRYLYIYTYKICCIRVYHVLCHFYDPVIS